MWRWDTYCFVAQRHIMDEPVEDEDMKLTIFWKFLLQISTNTQLNFHIE